MRAISEHEQAVQQIAQNFESELPQYYDRSELLEQIKEKEASIKQLLNHFSIYSQLAARRKQNLSVVLHPDDSTQPIIEKTKIHDSYNTSWKINSRQLINHEITIKFQWNTLQPIEGKFNQKTLNIHCHHNNLHQNTGYFSYTHPHLYYNCWATVNSPFLMLSYRLYMYNRHLIQLQLKSDLLFSCEDSIGIIFAQQKLSLGQVLEGWSPNEDGNAVTLKRWMHFREERSNSEFYIGYNIIMNVVPIPPPLSQLQAGLRSHQKWQSHIRDEVSFLGINNSPLKGQKLLQDGLGQNLGESLIRSVSKSPSRNSPLMQKRSIIKDIQQGSKRIDLIDQEHVIIQIEDQLDKYEELTVEVTKQININNHQLQIKQLANNQYLLEAQVRLQDKEREGRMTIRIQQFTYQIKVLVNQTFYSVKYQHSKAEELLIKINPNCILQIVPGIHYLPGRTLQIKKSYDQLVFIDGLYSEYVLKSALRLKDGLIFKMYPYKDFTVDDVANGLRFTFKMKFPQLSKHLLFAVHCISSKNSYLELMQYEVQERKYDMSTVVKHIPINLQEWKHQLDMRGLVNQRTSYIVESAHPWVNIVNGDQYSTQKPLLFQVTRPFLKTLKVHITLFNLSTHQSTWMDLRLSNRSYQQTVIYASSDPRFYPLPKAEISSQSRKNDA